MCQILIGLSLLIIYYFYFYNSFRLSESKLVIDKLSYLADTIEISTKENKLYEVDLKKDLDTYEINILELLFKEHLLDNNGVDISYTKSNIYLSIPSDTLNISPIEIRMRNLIEPRKDSCIASGSIKKCIEMGKEKFNWNDRYPRKVIPDGKIRGYEMAVTIQGSGIAEIDTGSVMVRLNDTGTSLLV